MPVSSLPPADSFRSASRIGSCWAPSSSSPSSSSNPLLPPCPASSSPPLIVVLALKLKSTPSSPPSSSKVLPPLPDPASKGARREKRSCRTCQSMSSSCHSATWDSKRGNSCETGTPQKKGEGGARTLGAAHRFPEEYMEERLTRLGPFKP